MEVELAASVAVPFSSELDMLLRSTGFKGMKAALERSDLWHEVRLFHRMMYKNNSQHRGSKHWQYLLQVQRQLRLLDGLNLAQLFAHLGKAARGSTVPVSSAASLVRFSRPATLNVPQVDSVTFVMKRLLAACTVVLELHQAVQKAASQLSAQLALTYFMPLSLTALAMLARTRVLTAQLLLDACKAYNALATLVVVLPAGLSSSVRTEALWQLPQMVSCSWHAGLPTLEKHAGLSTTPAGGTAGPSQAHLATNPQQAPAADHSVQDPGQKVDRTQLAAELPAAKLAQQGTTGLQHGSTAFAEKAPTGGAAPRGAGAPPPSQGLLVFEERMGERDVLVEGPRYKHAVPGLTLGQSADEEQEARSRDSACKHTPLESLLMLDRQQQRPRSDTGPAAALAVGRPVSRQPRTGSRADALAWTGPQAVNSRQAVKAGHAHQLLRPAGPLADVSCRVTASDSSSAGHATTAAQESQVAIDADSKPLQAGARAAASTPRYLSVGSMSAKPDHPPQDAMCPSAQPFLSPDLTPSAQHAFPAKPLLALGNTQRKRKRRQSQAPDAPSPQTKSWDSLL